ncbi:MAG: DegV family protein, partial [Ruminococcus sp.]|nr:DegV family protein [Ruminococcus sp.]
MSKYGDYVLFTDSTCDMPNDMAEDFDIKVMPMGFLMEEKAYNHFLDAREMSLDEFYSKLKSGIQSQTTQIAFNTYAEYWEPYLKEGKDIVYIAFTSGLSGTYNTSKIAARDLLENYPDRNITIIDSLCASAGQGALMYYVGKKYKEDKPTSEEIAAYAEGNKLKMCHWFVVDDIEQLKRGGRISAVTATFAKALQIKPVLSVDNEGKLVNVGKIRGSNGINDLLINKMKRDAVDYKNQTIIVAHADNKDGAKELKKKVKGMVKD